MKIKKLISIALSSFTFFIGCSEDSILQENPEVKINDIQITAYGSENSFDLATWNIEQFPKSRSYTIPYLTQIIRDIDIDLIAAQEIDDRSSFFALIDSLDGYEGYLSSLPDYGLQLGLIYKSNVVTISDPDQIFTTDDWAFPRPPLVASVSVKNDSITFFDFIIIVLHLKAFGDQESESRRRTACEKLKDYIDNSLLTESEKDIIVLGDFNDQLDDPPQDNVFEAFLSDTLNYDFLTLPLTDEPTYINNYFSSIDHVLITNDVRVEYNSGDTQVLKIDEEFSDYLNYISDHRPVLSRFFFN